MKINKDNVIGAIVMLLIVAVVVWGWGTTVKIDRVAKAHDNLVQVMSPVINQIQQANAQMQQQQANAQRARPQASAVPAPVQQQPEAPKTVAK